MNTETKSIANEEKKESFLWLHLVSAFLLVFSTCLTSPDPTTRMVTGILLFTAALVSFYTTRKKLNVIGIILFSISVYFLILLTLVTFEA